MWPFKRNTNTLEQRIFDMQLLLTEHDAKFDMLDRKIHDVRSMYSTENDLAVDLSKIIDDLRAENSRLRSDIDALKTPSTHPKRYDERLFEIEEWIESFKNNRHTNIVEEWLDSSRKRVDFLESVNTKLLERWREHAEDLHSRIDANNGSLTWTRSLRARWTLFWSSVARLIRVGPAASGQERKTRGSTTGETSSHTQ